MASMGLIPVIMGWLTERWGRIPGAALRKRHGDVQWH
jgi:hypothetical protein